MNWWNHLKPQIEEYLSNLCFQGYYSDDVQAVLSEDNWMQHDLFKSARFNYRKAEWTLQGLCDTFSLLTGDQFGGDAIRGSLKYNILELVKHEKYQREVEQDIKEEVA